MPSETALRIGSPADPRPPGRALWCGDDVAFECDYLEPPDLDSAVAELRAGSGLARIVAGGQSLLPALRSSWLEATSLVSLRRIAALKCMSSDAHTMTIGSEVTFSEFLASPNAARLPFLAEALKSVGNLTIRNRTSFGGTIAWADPTGALLLALAMLDAVVVTTQRRLSSADCVAGMYRNTLASDEIIVGIEIALPPTARSFAFRKTSLRRSGGKALASVAIGLESAGAGKPSIRLGLIGLQDRAWVSPWHQVGEPGDLDAEVDKLLAAAPHGQRISPLMPSSTYLRASAALLAKHLLKEMRYGS